MPTDQLTPVPLHALCIACNYSLRGLTSNRCPECGRDFDPADPLTMNLRKPIGRFGRRLLRPRIWPLILCLLAVTGWHAWVARFPGPLAPRDARHAFYAWTALGGLWLLIMLARLCFIALRRPPGELRQRVWRRWLPLVAAMAGAFWLVQRDRPFRAALWVSGPYLARFEAELLSNAPQYTYPNHWIGLFPADHIYSTGDAVGFHVVDRQQGHWWLFTSAWTKGTIRVPAGGTPWIHGSSCEVNRFGRWRLVYGGLSESELHAIRRHELMRWIATDAQRSADNVALLVESLKSPSEEWETWESQTAPAPDRPSRRYGSETPRGLTLRWDMCGLRRLGLPAVAYLRPALKSPIVQSRLNSTITLRLLRQDAAEATDDLAIALTDGDAQVRREAAAALGAIGPAARRAAPALGQALSDPDEDVSLLAVAALRRVNPEPAVAIAGIRATLDYRAAQRAGGRARLLDCQTVHGQIDCATQVVELLGDCGPGAVPLLLDILRNPQELAYGRLAERFGYFEPAVRPAAFAALAKTGPRSRETDAALGEILKREEVWEDAPKDARSLVVELGRSDPQWAIWLERRVQAQPPKDANYDWRPDSALALAELSPDNQALMSYLFAGEGGEWKNCGSALGPAAKNSPQIMATLTRQLANPPHDLTAAVALHAAGHDALALPVLLNIAKTDPSRRDDALRELAKMKSHATAIAPRLTPLISGDNVALTLDVIRALLKLQPELAIPPSVRLLHQPDLRTRARGARFLGEAGPAARPALPDLVEVIADRQVSDEARETPTPTMRPARDLLRYALTALAHIGPEARAAASPAILGLLARLPANDYLQAECATTLLAINATGDDVIRAATALLRSPDPRARLAAARLLGGIGPSARSALPILDEVYLSELSDEVRDAIDEAKALMKAMRNCQ